MSKILKLILPVLFILLLGSVNANAQDVNLFGRPKMTTFKGENQNWLVVHQMYLIGTEIEYDIKIRYKGNDDKLKSLPSLHYSITDKDGELSGTFSLKYSNMFQSERMECFGCKYLDKKKEVTFIIGEWEDYEEILILKRE